MRRSSIRGVFRSLRRVYRVGLGTVGGVVESLNDSQRPSERPRVEASERLWRIFGDGVEDVFRVIRGPLQETSEEDRRLVFGSLPGAF